MQLQDSILRFGCWPYGISHVCVGSSGFSGFLLSLIHMYECILDRSLILWVSQTQTDVSFGVYSWLTTHTPESGSTASLLRMNLKPTAMTFMIYNEFLLDFYIREDIVMFFLNPSAHLGSGYQMRFEERRKAWDYSPTHQGKQNTDGIVVHQSRLD